MVALGGFPLAIALVIWALSIGGIARIAVGRGRNPFGWALGAAVASALGVTGGGQLTLGVLDADDTGLVFSVLSLVLPLLGLLVPFAVLAVVLVREPIVVSARDVWRVHFSDRGAGTLRVTEAGIRLESSAGVEEVGRSEILGVEPDGECLRLRLVGGEVTAMMMGTPDTAAGRREQSRRLALRLRR